MSAGMVWGIILALGVLTYLIRFSFLGVIGSRKMPEWLLRHLRYTPVAVLPGLVAPLVLWPAATGGEPDLARSLAALVAILVGMWARNTLAAIGAGAVVLYAALGLGALI